MSRTLWLSNCRTAEFVWLINKFFNLFTDSLFLLVEMDLAVGKNPAAFFCAEK
jgi:hypothetical protein